jgi:polyhydroxyalkanoate synthesis regulator phasin
VRELLRLWGTTADNVLTELFATDAYARAQGRLVNAAMAYRLAEAELGDLFLETVNVPTRRQLDEANRAIHELRREVRRLRKEVRG